MIGAILGIVLTAAAGALCVPVLMLALARFGYFEPIRFRLWGRAWNFAPPDTVSPGSFVMAFAPLQRQTVFASVVTAAYSVAAPIGPIDGMRHLETGALVSGQIRDVRRIG